MKFDFLNFKYTPPPKKMLLNTYIYYLSIYLFIYVFMLLTSVYSHSVGE